MSALEPFDASRPVYEGAHVGGVDLSGQALPPVELYDTRLTRMGLCESTLRRWVFETCTVHGCDLSNIDLGDSAFEDVHLEGCRLVGVDWTRARAVPFSVRFSECNLRLARFTGRSLRGVAFVHCDLRDVDFAEADLRRARFVGCDLAGALFERSDLRQADLSGATGLDLDPADNRVQGARIDLATAGRLAHRYGFTVVA